MPAPIRYSVQLPTHQVDDPEEFISGEALAEMARALESAGFDAGFVTDHPFPGDRWLAEGGHHTLDPFVALSFAAAATERLRLHTHVLVLAYRNPFLVAKQAASLDVASRGRLILGTAAGYLKSEFHALGADYARRNETADEAIDAIRKAWTEDGVEFVGRGFSARGNSMRPRPLQRPHPPLWVGGNSKQAIRRAVERGDGWVPFPNSEKFASRQGTAVIATFDDLRERLDYARAHAERVGRTAPLDVCFAPIGVDMFADHAPNAEGVRAASEELAGMGVSWVALSVPARTRAEYCDRVHALGAGLAGHA
ncbi:MAG: LLM class F420-dependent oxidoreductase [Deltaproteobacteria bacterium]|nr:LLM class F420-dependent oxidoreductase [Deltaproteobacteria bacterium]